MLTSTLHIKNMVCGRCIKVVRDELEKLGYIIKHIELGKVEFIDQQEVDEVKIRDILEKEGFELIDDKSAKIINAVKSIVIQQVHHEPVDNKQLNLSTVLEKEIGKSYSSLSTLFSNMEGRTIEKFAIQQRIERVKELLVYGQKSVSEIAWELGYSSTQYLSNQFKSETGLTPSAFRKIISSNRKHLDKI